MKLWKYVKLENSFYVGFNNEVDINYDIHKHDECYLVDCVHKNQKHEEKI